LTRFGQEEPLEVLDITPFVVEQRVQKGLRSLVTPLESLYTAQDNAVCTRIGLDVPREAS